jgi:F0F1-type ATP synthase membrane subunit b/b'
MPTIGNLLIDTLLSLYFFVENLNKIIAFRNQMIQEGC